MFPLIASFGMATRRVGLCGKPVLADPYGDDDARLGPGEYDRAGELIDDAALDQLAAEARVTGCCCHGRAAALGSDDRELVAVDRAKDSKRTAG